MDGKQWLLARLTGVFLLTLLTSPSVWTRQPRAPAQSPGSMIATPDSRDKPKPVKSASINTRSVKPQPVDTFGVGIKRLGNISLPWSSPKHGLRGNINFCVFSGNGAYRITLSSQARDGRFYLENNHFKLPIDIYFNDKAGIRGRRILREGMTLGGLVSRNRKPSCQGLNANLSVVVSPQALHTALAGKYRGWFLLEISPE